ncbi:MAG: hypothetical protein RLZZ237_1607, partial [Pseudomonadota bacterium]
MSLYRKLAGSMLLGLATAGIAHAQSPTPAAAPASDPAVSDPAGTDPYLWLEDVLGEKSLAWVKQHNAVSVKELEGQPGFPALQARLKTILNSKERIPYVSKNGEYYYNFWRDAQHVRGIWRRTTLAQFETPDPAWETVIDLDQLAASEHENWVWAGASCLYPKGERCLISLSRGGGDANVVREYDVAKRAFVEGGFSLPEAKGSASWIDQDTLFVS